LATTFSPDPKQGIALLTENQYTLGQLGAEKVPRLRSTLQTLVRIFISSILTVVVVDLSELTRANLDNLVSQDPVVGVHWVTSKSAVVALTLANVKEALLITFDGVSTNGILAKFLQSNGIKKGGLQLDRLAGLLSIWHEYQMNEMFELNETPASEKDLEYLEGIQSDIPDLFRRMSGHPTLPDIQLIKPHEWLRVDSLAAMTQVHMTSSSALAMMAFALTKEKIKDGFQSFSWSHLNTVAGHPPLIQAILRKMALDANAWLRSHEMLKDIAFQHYTVDAPPVRAPLYLR
jgi:hypothetical protein